MKYNMQHGSIPLPCNLLLQCVQEEVQRLHRTHALVSHASGVEPPNKQSKKANAMSGA